MPIRWPMWANAIQEIHQNNISIAVSFSTFQDQEKCIIANEMPN